MTRCRTILVGLLLVHSAIGQFESNIFMNGYKNDINAFVADQEREGEMDLSNNIFINHAISSRAADAFQGPQYLPPNEKQQLICSGQEVCVRANQCQGGYFTQNFGESRQDCDIDREVCCLYRPPPPKPTPVPSTPCLEANYDCISPNQCANGEISIRGYNKPKSADRCFAPEVCCRIPEPESTVLTDEGYFVRVPENPLITPERPTPASANLPQPQGRPTQRPTFAPRPTAARVQPTYAPRQPAPQPQPTYQPRPQAPITQRPTPRPTFAQRIPTTQAPLYLPPNPVGASSNNEPSRTKPQVLTGEDLLSEPIQPSKPRQPTPQRPQKVVTTRRPITGSDELSEPIARVPSSCAAALICTPVEYCTSTGFISESPVNLTPEQALFRVPLTDCRNQETGVDGKCCQDPNYKDPWTATQLMSYNATFFGDDGSYRPQGNNGRAQRQSVNRVVRQPSQRRSFQQFAASQNAPVQAAGFNSDSTQCSTRNFNTVPKGETPIDASFGEFPWQAMVLLESTKSLLCGGAIIADDIVLTSARCVKGRKPFDVLIKGGEWKLGRDEEPLDFQIKRARKIEIHPKYDANTLEYDLAILHLDSKLKFAQHIGAICVDESDVAADEQCVTTGWGKQAISLHLQDAVMHQSVVSPVPDDQCYPTQHSICGRTNIDGCSLDFGSALACSNGRGNYVLKGIFTAEDKCGDSYVTFAKPDTQWINANRGRRLRY